MINRWYLVAFGLMGCKYDAPPNPNNGDGGGIDMQVDAGPCQALGPSCLDGDTLATCITLGELPTEDTCGWGCESAGTAHCKVITPSGGGVTPADTDPATLTTLGAVTPGVNIDASGTIDGAVAGTDFLFAVSAANNIGVFRVKSLHVTTAVTLVGDRPIAIVADGPIVIDALIDARGCVGSLQTPGPGGFSGAASGTAAAGSGGGVGSTVVAVGPGGGGHAGAGGVGGGAAGAAGGTPFGDQEISVLVGGGGGGGGAGGGGAGEGGGGGGAVQLVSNTSITINATGGINAGGCGGVLGGGSGGDNSGGGGAGGAILLEAPVISISGSLAVNGGGGGGSDGGGNGVNGTLDRVQAAGGAKGGGGGEAGGNGAAATILAGDPGKTATQASGGGGGIGWIRFNVLPATMPTVDNTKLSPALDDMPATTCTAGDATLN